VANFFFFFFIERPKSNWWLKRICVRWLC